jgi:dipeptidyl aminopeptidase/acylaminoacyl peptidase
LRHEGEVRNVAFRPDGHVVLTASGDGTARLWDAATGQAIGEPANGADQGLFPSFNSAEFSPDGKRVLTAATSPASVQLWDLFRDTQDLVEHAKADAPRCLTPAERKEFFLPPEPPLWCIELGKWPYRTAAWEQWLKAKRAGDDPSRPSEK